MTSYWRRYDIMCPLGKTSRNWQTTLTQHFTETFQWHFILPKLINGNDIYPWHCNMTLLKQCRVAVSLLSYGSFVYSLWRWLCCMQKQVSFSFFLSLSLKQVIAICQDFKTLSFLLRVGMQTIGPYKEWKYCGSSDKLFRILIYFIFIASIPLLFVWYGKLLTSQALAFDIFRYSFAWNRLYESWNVNVISA